MTDPIRQWTLYVNGDGVHKMTDVDFLLSDHVTRLEAELYDVQKGRRDYPLTPRDIGGVLCRRAGQLPFFERGRRFQAGLTTPSPFP
jgi:hypothetical protein